MSARSWSSFANGAVILSIAILIVVGRPDIDPAGLPPVPPKAVPTTTAQIVQDDEASTAVLAPTTTEARAPQDRLQSSQLTRLSASVEWLGDSQPDDAALRAERWRNQKGREFAAVSCLIMGGPSFVNGCVPPDPGEDIRVVRVVQLPAAEGASASVAEGLDGYWENSGLSLRIDPKRAQAKYDAERPLEWKRFLIRAVEGEGVIFAIGSDVYQAQIEPDRLVLTSTLFRGEQVLYRR
jgi:hypothetical protein